MQDNNSVNTCPPKPAKRIGAPNFESRKPKASDLERLYHANVSVRADRSKFYYGLKRGFDIIGAIIGLILFMPVILVTAMLIKLNDGGSIFFKQNRVGHEGKLFGLYKFRSMHVNAEAMKVELMEQNQHSDNRTFKILNDPRVTPIGRFIRRLSIDEVPQFWNVLRGDMSLVGPRPALPNEVALYGSRDFNRLFVKPGLTCIWQVSGRSNLEFTEQIELDIDYINTRNTLLDLKLIALTPLAVVRGDGAA